MAKLDPNEVKDGRRWYRLSAGARHVYRFATLLEIIGITKVFYSSLYGWRISTLNDDNNESDNPSYHRSAGMAFIRRLESSEAWDRK